MSTEDYDTLAPDDEELLTGLRRSVAGATLTTSAADVVALGRRTRTRHRVLAAGIGTSAAAIVAAVGVLAPSAGTSPGTAAPGSAVPGTATVLKVQDAGFTLEEHSDGTVMLSYSDMFDPARLMAALDKAGVANVAMMTQVPEDWDMGRGVQCTLDPGVHAAGESAGAYFRLVEPKDPKKPGHVEIDKSKMPAGVYLTLMRFESHGQTRGGSLAMYVGRQTDCVLEHQTATDAHE